MDDTAIADPKIETALQVTRPGKRQPTTGQAQADRQAWGRTWGPILAELAAAKRSDQDASS